MVPNYDLREPKVSDLITNRRWNFEEKRKHLWVLDVDLISSIPLGRMASEDKISQAKLKFLHGELSMVSSRVWQTLPRRVLIAVPYASGVGVSKRQFSMPFGIVPRLKSLVSETMIVEEIEIFVAIAWNLWLIRTTPIT
ncbi:hypothetical protein TIFTF001_043408 [Ficus carica]|uniref:Uncharacterized protein n=1 Tax=Ficus carica TaxID=3494 RepID=A0AA88CM54_FICCA|nr:hypothetical protein TIFTF001_043408 [Ficus carica]